MSKQKWPYEVAMGAAAPLLEHLQETSHWAVIAGSLRRRKQQVGDVELLYMPKWEGRPDPEDLFGRGVAINLVDERLDELLGFGIIEKRLNKEGNETWGPSIKLARHVATGVPVDFFSASQANWHNYLVCRTGPADWKWKPYSSGFRSGLTQRDMNSEREVFEFVGLPYKEPWER